MKAGLGAHARGKVRGEDEGEEGRMFNLFVTPELIRGVHQRVPMLLDSFENKLGVGKKAYVRYREWHVEGRFGAEWGRGVLPPCHP